MCTFFIFFCFLCQMLNQIITFGCTLTSLFFLFIFVHDHLNCSMPLLIIKLKKKENMLRQIFCVLFSGVRLAGQDCGPDVCGPVVNYFLATQHLPWQKAAPNSKKTKTKTKTYRKTFTSKEGCLWQLGKVTKKNP